MSTSRHHDQIAQVYRWWATVPSGQTYEFHTLKAVSEHENIYYIYPGLAITNNRFRSRKGAWPGNKAADVVISKEHLCSNIKKRSHKRRKLL